jgi:chorismate lyase/3-hydroxybenzoate synthase
VVQGWQDGIGFAHGQDILFAHLLLADLESTDLMQGACTAYTRLLAFIRSRGYPHPLRMWNFVSRIHERNPEGERYQAFCVGRDHAFRLAGIAPAQFPAATAVGAGAPGLLIYLFAGRTPGRPVENPRQVSAYRYPPRYGPRPPSFARAVRYCWPGGSHFFVSGTASVVGHRSLHPGELGPQLRETLFNLDALSSGAGAGRPAFLKVFLRDPGHLAQAEAGLRRWAPTDTPALYLQAEVCREELEIEIEGVYGPLPDGSE